MSRPPAAPFSNGSKAGNSQGSRRSRPPETSSFATLESTIISCTSPKISGWIQAFPIEAAGPDLRAFCHVGITASCAKFPGNRKFFTIYQGIIFLVNSQYDCPFHDWVIACLTICTLSPICQEQNMNSGRRYGRPDERLRHGLRQAARRDPLPKGPVRRSGRPAPRSKKPGRAIGRRAVAPFRHAESGRLIQNAGRGHLCRAGGRGRGPRSEGQEAAV